MAISKHDSMDNCYLLARSQICSECVLKSQKFLFTRPSVRLPHERNQPHMTEVSLILYSVILRKSVKKI